VVSTLEELVEFENTRPKEGTKGLIAEIRKEDEFKDLGFLAERSSASLTQPDSELRGKWWL
jgi:hypothetical protein